MRSKQDWLSPKHNVLYIRAQEVWSYFSGSATGDGVTNGERMGFVTDSPQHRWVDLVFLPKVYAFCEAYRDWENPSTRAKKHTARLRETERAFKTVYRQLYNGFLRANPLVTDGDLQAMNMPTRRVSWGSPSPVPTSYPKCKVDTSVIRRLTFRLSDNDSGGRAKPAGVHSAEMRWAILDHRPASEMELIHSAIDTRTSFVLDISEAERGKTVWYAFRWANTRCRRGPFGEILSAIVP